MSFVRSRMQRSPRFARFMFNTWPCIRGTGVRVTHLAADWSELRLRLPLSWRTRNYVGTIFGGSMYAGVDPFLMLMLMHRLGNDYVVWDKSAAIRFRRPGTQDLHATFRIDDEEIASIRAAVESESEITREYEFDLVDESGVAHANISKSIYIASKAAYRAKRAARTGGGG